MDINTEKISVQLNKMKAKMNTKKLMVSFCAVAIALFLVAPFVMAATSPLASISSIEVNGVQELGNEDVSVIAGNSLTVKVFFTALEDASNVKMEAELTGTRVSVNEQTSFFDVERGMKYVKTIVLDIPYELKDEVSDNLTLNVKLWNGEFSTDSDEITLRVQRPSYNADVLSISTSQSVNAGEIVPVTVVLKNTGYNNIDDAYVTLKVVELGVQQKMYFGDLASIETSDNDDTVSGKFYIRIPYEAPEGVYTLEADAESDDLSVKATKQVIVRNDFSNGNIVVTNYRQVVAAGENAEYSLMLVNPTNQLKVYRIVADSSDALHTSASGSVVSVPAGLSKTVTINANAVKEGEYTFDVSVLSGETLEGVASFNLGVEGRSANGAAVLTIILAIIFVVLLVVLIVLLGKRPKKAEEFGESYY